VRAVAPATQVKTIDGNKNVTTANAGRIRGRLGDDVSYSGIALIGDSPGVNPNSILEVIAEVDRSPAAIRRDDTELLGVADRRSDR
jgi:hypothetical protein